MNRLRLTVAALGAVVLLSGCGFDRKYVAVDPTEWTAKPQGYEVPLLEETTERAHKVLGELTVSTRIQPNFKQESTYDRAVAELKREAGKRGADAVTGFRTRETDEGGHTRLIVSGQLIIFTAPPPLASR
jgi:uncharacterized protein YbjQ (UPF0145 family)